MTLKNIAVVFGGVSSEHEVSRRSCATVLENLDTERFRAYPIGITKDGRWYLYEGPISKIPDGSWELENNRRAVISPDRLHGGLIVEDGEVIAIDAAIPVLHGKNGEDGTIQGLFTLAGIPFVGPSTLASAVCMDKAVANTMFDACGVPHCKWDFSTRESLNDQTLERFEQNLGYPMFIKPANAGSSVGVSKVKNRAALVVALRLALLHDHKVVAEEAVVGQEIECAVYGNDAPRASVIGEIIPPEDEFYSYDEKYTTATTSLRIPADIPEHAADTARELAVKAYSALGCEGLSRCDFFLRACDGKVLINEINTLPGFTSISMYPKLMEASGTPIKALISGLIDLALERGAR